LARGPSIKDPWRGSENSLVEGRQQDNNRPNQESSAPWSQQAYLHPLSLC
jgi:hypothetical protein